MSAKRRGLEYFTPTHGPADITQEGPGEGKGSGGGAEGYSAQDGYWSDAGTFESLLRVGEENA